VRMLSQVEPLNPERTAWLRSAIEHTETWIAEVEREVLTERAFLRPVPDGDWDYDYIFVQEKQVVAARLVLGALASELAVAQENAELLHRVHSSPGEEPEAV
jgi:hypothetical protein